MNHMYPYRSPSPSPQPEQAHARCTYTGRMCHQPRATKANGELHSLCDVHRAKANNSQRNSQQRKKQKTERTTAAVSATFDSAPLLFGAAGLPSVFAAPERFDAQVETCSSAAQFETCNYSNCKATRAAKLSGGLHRYCLKHRGMARKHQRSYSKKKVKTTPISPGAKTQNDAFSYNAPAFRTAETFGATEVVDDMFATPAPVNGHLSGSFSLLADYVPYSTAAHVFAQEVAGTDPAVTASDLVSTFFEQAQVTPADDASVWLQGEEYNENHETTLGGGASSGSSTSGGDFHGPFSVLLADVPPHSANVFLELAELDGLFIPGQRAMENGFDRFF